MRIPARRTLLTLPALTAALVTAGGSAASAYSVPGRSEYALKALRYPALGTATLRRGSRGSAVRSLQNLLNHAKRLRTSNGTWYSPCPLAEDGVFGSSTEKRLRDGQRAFGVTADGVVGPATRAAAMQAYRNGDIR